jgi:hypothetical protein
MFRMRKWLSPAAAAEAMASLRNSLLPIFLFGICGSPFLPFFQVVHLGHAHGTAGLDL